MCVCGVVTERVSKGSRGFRKGGSLRLDSECELGAKRRRKSVFRVKKAQEDGSVTKD